MQKREFTEKFGILLNGKLRAKIPEKCKIEFLSTWK